MSIAVLWSNHGNKICTRNCCITQRLIPAAHRLVWLAQIVSHPLRRAPICRLSELVRHLTQFQLFHGEITSVRYLLILFADQIWLFVLVVIYIQCQFMKHIVVHHHKWWSDNTFWASSATQWESLYELRGLDQTGHTCNFPIRAAGLRCRTMQSYRNSPFLALWVRTPTRSVPPYDG